MPPDAATVDGTTLTVTFDEALDPASVPPGDTVTVSYTVPTGGGLRWTDPAWGLMTEWTVRRLLAHQEGGFEEWGGGGSMRFDPGEPNRGLSLTVAPSRGVAASGMDRLWSGREEAVVHGGPASAAGRLEAELSYGLSEWRGRGILTPYAGLSQSGGDSRDWRMGIRWTLGPAFNLSLEGARRETAGPGTDHGLLLRTSMNW